jgi:anaerobic magnesium-protoporphyrin IX monomethyl ester cyclase
MKILLAYLCNYKERKDYFTSLMPVGLLSIAAYLEQKGYEVILANFSRTGFRKTAERITKLKPDVVGISMYTHNRADSLKLAQGIKKSLRGVRIILGGPHATFLADEIIRRYSYIDYVIRGEGETSMGALLEAIKSGKAPGRSVIEGECAADINSLPRPVDFTGETIDINVNEQMKYIITTRGCSGNCNFCSSPGFWKRNVRYVSAGNIMKELENLYSKQGIIYFSVRDDNFTLKKKRVMEFTRLLRDSGIYMMWNCQSRVDSIDEEMLAGMKMAGLEMIQFGVETGSERILDKYNKRITIGMIESAAAAARKAGVYLSIYLMAGMKGERHSDIKKTLSLIHRILPGDGIVSPVALYPGTELYEDAVRDGAVDRSVWFKKADPGIYLRNDREVITWIRELLDALSMIRVKSWYRDRDFTLHKRHIGPDCWVTDILEGDYYLDEERHERAETCYNRVISAHPRNPWGFMRMGKLKFRTGEFDTAEECYNSVTDIVPAYYGGWMKLAECQIAQGKIREARICVEEAYNKNRFDFRIRHLRELVK